jgi:hypothetical protein
MAWIVFSAHSSGRRSRSFWATVVLYTNTRMAKYRALAKRSPVSICSIPHLPFSSLIQSSICPFSLWLHITSWTETAKSVAIQCHEPFALALGQSLCHLCHRMGSTPPLRYTFYRLLYSTILIHCDGKGNMVFFTTVDHTCLLEGTITS